MIRGPVVPLTREGLWRLLREHPDLVEHGLQVVAEDLELGTGELGLVDGLLRDASGAPVLALVTDERDAALVARVIAAHAFWQRNVLAIGRAMPEARLRAGAPCRLLVVASELAPGTAESLARLGIERLELVELERFHVGDQERMVVRTRCPGVRAAPPDGVPALDAAVRAGDRAIIDAVTSMLLRLDPRIRIDGDRFTRRALHEGRLLCWCWSADDLVLSALPGEEPRTLEGVDDARAFVDRVARHHLEATGDRSVFAARGAEPAAAPLDGPSAAPGRASGLEGLRASMSLARLSQAECTALGETMPEEDPRNGG